MSCVVHNMI